MWVIRKLKIIQSKDVLEQYLDVWDDAEAIF